MFTLNVLASGSFLLYLAVANPLPQNLDFDQIDAAPAVPSGPVDNGIVNQTATLYTDVVVSTAASVSAAAAVTNRNIRRSSTQYITTNNAQFGSTGSQSVIDAGSLVWLSGADTHNIYGNLNNLGSLVISQTTWLKNHQVGGMTADWVGHDSYNGNLKNAAGALIQLNDIGSASAPTYDWFLHSMTNDGTLQWCGRGDTGGSTYQLFTDLDSINNGLISFEQVFNNYGASFYWKTTSLSSQVYNNGAFRLINVNFQNVQNVYGNGCWQLGNGAILYLQDGTGSINNPTNGPSFPNQSIMFQDATAVLHMDTAVYSRSSNFGARLYNFGSGNAVEFYQTISRFNYDTSSGTLSVYMIGGNYVNLRIGTGYDPSKFSNQRNSQKYNMSGYNAIFYSGRAPSQSIPSTCSISAPVCSDLGTNPPAPPTTSTSSTLSTSVSITSTAPKVITTSTAPSSTSITSTSTTLKSSVTTVTTATTTHGPQSTRYTPTYPALTTSSGGTPTTGSQTACATTPENGTYCGFINPEDPCAPQPDGYGPVPTPDTASAFLAYAPFQSMASAAPTVVPASNNTQYTQTFCDLNAASSAQSYLGLLTIRSYDPGYCASACDKTKLCTAFNIFIERDPSLNPTNNDSSLPSVWGYNCPNPAAMTSYKCTLWGSNLDASTAVNTGQYREQFQVVITGSNGYDKTNVTKPADPTAPTTPPVAPSLSSTTIVTSPSAAGPTSSAPSQPVSTAPAEPWNSPKNCHGKAIDNPKGWLGSRFFPGPYNPQVCSDFALKQNSFNRQQAMANGQNKYSACQMFNAYYLNKNDQPHGTYCSLYTSDLDPAIWATNSGGHSDGDNYECTNSWTWSLTVPDPGTC